MYIKIIYIFLIFLFSKNRATGRYAFVEKGPVAVKDDVTIKNVSYEPGAPGSEGIYESVYPETFMII